MLGQAVSEETRKPKKKKVLAVVQKEKVDEERIQGWFVGREINNMKGIWQSRNKGLKRGISKSQV